MTLIGLAYNQKPEQQQLLISSSADVREDEGENSRSDEEPPSSRDEFAEWASPETIDAVESALKKIGKVVRLEANEEFPERLRRTRPDIVFNIAEGLNGVNREAHVPAICEFYGVPYSGSDPF